MTTSIINEDYGDDDDDQSASKFIARIAETGTKQLVPTTAGPSKLRVSGASAPIPPLQCGQA